MIRTAALLLVLATLRLHAYAAFDSVESPDPIWMFPRADALTQPLGDTPSVVYRVQRRGADAALFDVVNRGTTPVDVVWTLPGFTPNEVVLRFHLEAGASAAQTIPITPMTQDVVRAAVAPPGGTGTGIGTDLTAFGATATTADARFAPHLFAYTMQADPQGRIDVHWRWDGDRPVHAAWRIIGRPGLVLPRLHLLPGNPVEVVIDAPADALLSRRIIDVYDVRLGDDHGPLLVPDNTERAPVTWPERSGWRPSVPSAWANPAWNASAVCWQAVTDAQGALLAVKLWNRSAVSVHLRYDQPQLGFSGDMTLASGAEGTATVPGRPAAAGCHHLWTHALALDGVPLPPASALINPTIPAGARPVIGDAVDARFNPHQLVALPTATNGGGVAVQLVNRYACALRGTLRLAGAEAPFALTPGGTATVTMPNVRYSLRLAASEVHVAGLTLDGGW